MLVAGAGAGGLFFFISRLSNGACRIPGSRARIPEGIWQEANGRFRLVGFALN